MAESVRVISVEKLRGRYRVRLDNGDMYWLTKGMYAERPVQAEEMLDPEEYARWVLLRQYRPALEKAVAMLAARACSRGEISQKLKASGYSPQAVEMVLVKLEKERLLNDREFASQWARYRTDQRYGPRRIAAELKRKGLAEEDAEEALSALPEEEQLSRAKQLARKGFDRARADEDPRKTLQRVMAAIVRRGYDWDIARAACEAYIRQQEEE